MIYPSCHYTWHELPEYTKATLRIKMLGRRGWIIKEIKPENKTDSTHMIIIIPISLWNELLHHNIVQNIIGIWIKPNLLQWCKMKIWRHVMFHTRAQTKTEIRSGSQQYVILGIYKLESWNPRIQTLKAWKTRKVEQDTEIVRKWNADVPNFWKKITIISWKY